MDIVSKIIMIASNRTKVELKHAIEPLPKWVSKLPIEPKWNWNALSILIGCLFSSTSNRTKVELKLAKSTTRKNKIRTSNRTKVELKRNGLTGALKTPRLPIEPKWNWNWDNSAENTLGITTFQSNQSGIETFLISCLFINDITSNRTKVELKLRLMFSGRLSNPFQSNQSGIETQYLLKLVVRCLLPIEPKWNWNAVNTCYKKAGYYFQSNQSGIETIRYPWTSLFDTLPIEPKWNWNIEVYKSWYGEQTSNRTKVELKLVCKSFWIIRRNFQSNQSGIETNFSFC